MYFAMFKLQLFFVCVCVCVEITLLRDVLANIRGSRSVKGRDTIQLIRIPKVQCTMVVFCWLLFLSKFWIFRTMVCQLIVDSLK